MNTEAPKFNQTNIYRVRRGSRLSEGFFLSKLILKKHGTVQIEGMGQCIALVCKFSQVLQKNGFAIIESIKSDNVERFKREINPKLAITLKKSPQFDKLAEDIVLKN